MRAWLTFLLLAAAPAAVAEIEVRMAAPRPPARLVSSEMAWSCKGEVCRASGVLTDVPTRLCERFARDRDRGRLAAFAVDGVAMDAPALERCNARAR